MRRVLAGLPAAMLLAGAVMGGVVTAAPAAGSTGPYAATIVRDEVGVPHITAPTSWVTTVRRHR
jgi:acyl-homoserine lactone acylase PvdQ